MHHWEEETRLVLTSGASFFRAFDKPGHLHVSYADLVFWKAHCNLNMPKDPEGKKIMQRKMFSIPLYLEKNESLK
jgi:hypothetical protein